jgi:mRNA-degrading endonuclease HigB of HigAB toxin-antitoxin module
MLRRWRGPQDIKTGYGIGNILQNNRVVFKIKGNTYRLVAAMKYDLCGLSVPTWRTTKLTQRISDITIPDTVVTRLTVALD